MGVKSGFQKFLRNDVYSFFNFGCTCHSLALCANYAMNALSACLDGLLKDVFFYFAHSTKRLRDIN